MFRAFALAVALVGSLFAASSAQADRRIALVIGNGAYTQAAPLTNPANDARAVAAALERLGFEVVSGFDMSNADLRKAVRSFADKLVGADVALFFYAGHGLQVAGENYLIPVDAAIRSEADLDFNAVKMDLVSRQMDREAKVKIIMLDACRDNPFQKELTRSMGKTRSATVKQGLAEISNAGGTLIAFATDPGSVALDGDGRHSPFTTALLKHIETPGVEIGLIMRRVTKDVFELTGERQRPWTNASLTGELYLKPGDTAGAPQTPPQQPTASAPPTGFDDRQLELAMWQAADKSGQVADYEEYLKRYPNGQFAGMARNRLEAQKKERPGSAPGTAPTNTAGTDPTRAVDQSNRSADEATELQIGWTANDRVGVQRRLTLIGYDTRGADGSFGPATRGAITRWQQASNFQPTGYLNAHQYRELLNKSAVAYDAWQEQQRAAAARRAAAPPPQQQPPTASTRPPQQAPQQQPQQQGTSAGDVLRGVGTVRDTIRIFK